jgi:hypothetical protein
MPAARFLSIEPEACLQAAWFEFASEGPIFEVHHFAGG